MNDHPIEQTAQPLNDRRAMLAGIGGLAAGALMAGRAQAGPLNPPPGPIAPTPGPEPRIPINAANTPGDSTNLFKITQPGSYYLTGNITGEPGKNGIRIEAPSVTLDLNGFELRGVPGSLRGVDALNSPHAKLRNGNVVDWGGRGLSLQGEHTTVESINASGCGSIGIRVSDTGSTVRDCHASNNAADGLSLGSGSLAIDCTATGNAFDGISVGDGCTVIGCVSTGNASDGITTGQGCTISRCTCSSNTDDGLSCNATCSVTAVVCRGNGGSGIIVNNASTVTECSCSNNDTGIRSASGCVVQRCSTRFNVSYEISAGSSSLILENNCTSTAATCIRVTGSGNRIESNNCEGGAIGYQVILAGNMIIKNTCRQSTTKWDVVAGNIILVVNATTAGAVTGNTGGVSPGSTNPNANYSL